MSDQSQCTHPPGSLPLRPPMGAEERQATVEELRRQVQALASPPGRPDPIRRAVYSVEALIGPLADEIRDPGRAEAALDAVGEIVHLLWREREAAR